MPAAQDFAADGSATSLTASYSQPSSAGTEICHCFRQLAGLGASDGMAWVRALCMLIPAAGLPLRHDHRRAAFYRCVLFPPPPCCLPACLLLLLLSCVCVHMLAASLLDGRALMLLTEAHLCLMLPLLLRNGGRDFQVAKSRVAFSRVFTFQCT